VRRRWSKTYSRPLSSDSLKFSPKSQDAVHYGGPKEKPLSFERLGDYF
jgi:hypothetical protein